jgi:hypothetical protein
MHQRKRTVLEAAWRGGFTTKSDTARAYADEVAWAASSGLISTEEEPGKFGRVWRITPPGLVLLWEEDRA